MTMLTRSSNACTHVSREGSRTNYQQLVVACCCRIKPNSTHVPAPRASSETTRRERWMPGRMPPPLPPLLPPRPPPPPLRGLPPNPVPARHADQVCARLRAAAPAGPLLAVSEHSEASARSSRGGGWGGGSKRRTAERRRPTASALQPASALETLTSGTLWLRRSPSRCWGAPAPTGSERTSAPASILRAEAANKSLGRFSPEVGHNLSCTNAKK